jgi:hypothetical protein
MARKVTLREQMLRMVMTANREQLLEAQEMIKVALRERFGVGGRKTPRKSVGKAVGGSEV